MTVIFCTAFILLMMLREYSVTIAVPWHVRVFCVLLLLLPLCSLWSIAVLFGCETGSRWLS